MNFLDTMRNNLVPHFFWVNMRIRLFLFFIAASFGTPSYTFPLSLDQVIVFGLKNSSKLKNQRTDQINANLDLEVSKAAFYPSLDFSSRHGIADADPSEKDHQELSQFSFSLSQSLFNSFLDQHAKEQAEFGLKKSEIVLAETVSLLITDIYEAAFRYSQNVELLDSAKTKHKLIEEQFRALEQSYKGGFKPRTDYLRFKAQFQRSSISLETLKTSNETLLKSLASLIGMNPDQKLDFSHIKPNFQKLPNLGDLNIDYKKHYIARKTEFDEKIAAKSARIAKINNWPKVTVNLDANYGASDYLGTDSDFEDTDSTSWAAYVGLSYNIFDAGKRASEVEKAINSKLQVIESNLQKKRDLFRDGENLKETIRLNLKTAKLNLELFKLEEDNYKLLRTKYRQGQVNILELTTALENLESSKNSYIRSYYELLTSKARLWHHQARFHAQNYRLTY